MRFRFVLFCALAAPAAGAQPLHTWGIEPTDAPQSAVVTPPSRALVLEEATTEPTREPAPVSAALVLEGTEIRGNTATLDSVIRGRIPFWRGTVLDVDDPRLARLRLELLATGYFSDVTLSLRRGTTRGKVWLIVTVTEQLSVTINDVWLGLSATVRRDGSKEPLSAFGGIDITEHNFAGTGTSLGGAFAVASKQLGLRARLGHPDFLGSKFSIDTLVLYNQALDALGYPGVSLFQDAIERKGPAAVVPYRRFGVTLGAGHRVFSSSLRAYVDYRVESVDVEPTPFTSLRDQRPIRLFLQPQSSLVSSIRATGAYDTRTIPEGLGSLVSVFAEFSSPAIGSSYPFVKLTSRASHWLRLPWGHVLSPELFVGAIWGDSPLFDRYYVADFSDFLPDRVLELNVDRRPAPNVFGTIQGTIPVGTYAGRASLEYQVPIYRGRAAITSASAFARVGLYSVFSPADLDQANYPGARSIPLDLTGNIGLRIATALGPVTLSLSSLLFFLPVRADAEAP